MMISSTLYPKCHLQDATSCAACTFPFPSRAERVLKGGKLHEDWKRDVTYFHNFIFEIFLKIIRNSVGYPDLVPINNNKEPPYFRVPPVAMIQNNICNIIIDYLVHSPETVEDVSTFIGYHYDLSLEGLYFYCKTQNAGVTTLLPPCQIEDFYSQPKDHSYDLSSKRGDFKRITIRHAKNGYIQVTFDKKKGDSPSECYSIPSSLWHTSQGIIDHVDGAECQIIPRMHPTAHIIDKSYWDSWNNVTSASEFYCNHVYPLFKMAISTILHHRTHLTILDIGGGDGLLDFLLLREFPQISHCTVFDQSDTSISRIRRRQINDENAVIWQKITPIQRDITAISEVEYSVSWREFDVMLLSGVIAEFVLTRKESENVLKLPHTLLKDDGFVLISGYSNPHFAADDYNRFGFNVLNQVGTTGGASPVTIPFFVLQKKKSTL